MKSLRQTTTTYDGRRTKPNGKSSPGLWPGELKRFMELMTCLKKLSINLHNILTQLPPQGDTISCNGTERNETKRNNFVSCFINYYRDITILRNETIPFRVLVISYRWTVLSYFVPTNTRPTYICTRCSRAI